MNFNFYLIKLEENCSRITFITQKIAKAIVVVVGVIAILLELLGLVGAYKEHFCMTLTYAIIMNGETFLFCILAIKMRGLCILADFVISFLITILAYLFASDLSLKDGQSGQRCCA